MKDLLFLFDIDGTLISTQGAGRRAMNQALNEIYGWSDPLGEVNLAGATDKSIFAHVLQRHRLLLPPEDRQQHFQKWQQVYTVHLRELLQKDNRTIVHPGVREFIMQALEHDATIALLTGNVPVGALLKLESAGLDKEFFRFENPVNWQAEFSILNKTIEQANPWSVYGNMAADRNLLPALVPAKEKFTCIVIGDTEKDIECAHTNECLSIAVRTGHGNFSNMQKLKPAFFVDDLGGETFIQLTDWLSETAAGTKA